MSQQSIPRYFLYGEVRQDVDEHFLHWESIAARSRLHDWTIRPHAHRDLQHCLFVSSGKGCLRAEDASYEFAAPCFIVVPPSCVHGFEFSPGTDGWVVSAAGTLISRIGQEHPELAPVFNRVTVLPLSASAAPGMAALFNALGAEFRINLPARRAAVESTLVAIAVSALRLQIGVHDSPGLSADASLATRYRTLLEEHYASDMSVADYAERLCISQERLRVACVRTTASSPVALLHARRLLEAKRCLLYTNMNVALVAGACGFMDAAYFSRFFLRKTGKSPRAYRAGRHRPDNR